MLLLTPLPMPTLPELPTSRRCLYGLLGALRGIPGTFDRLGLPGTAVVAELRRKLVAGDLGPCGVGGAAKGIGPVELKTGRAFGFAALDDLAGDVGTCEVLSRATCSVGGGIVPAGMTSGCRGVG